MWDEPGSNNPRLGLLGFPTSYRVPLETFEQDTLNVLMISRDFGEAELAYPGAGEAMSPHLAAGQLPADGTGSQRGHRRGSRLGAAGPGLGREARLQVPGGGGEPWRGEELGPCQRGNPFLAMTGVRTSHGGGGGHLRALPHPVHWGLQL